MSKKEDTAPKFSDLAQLTYQNGVKLDGAIEVFKRIAESNDDIVKYKKEQKERDIEFGRRTTMDNKRSNILNIAGVVIALAALSVSIKGVDFHLDFLKGFF